MSTSCTSFYVAGVLVQAIPPAAAKVRERIGLVPGAVVHASDAAGRLVITLESNDSEQILQHLTALQVMDGVMSAVLVSEHSDPIAAADQEIQDVDAPPHPA
jgi:periplasmic nitrate reductase NapD